MGRFDLKLLRRKWEGKVEGAEVLKGDKAESLGHYIMALWLRGKMKKKWEKQPILAHFGSRQRQIVAYITLFLFSLRYFRYFRYFSLFFVIFVINSS